MSDSNPKGNILLVDDDKYLTEMLNSNLSSEGFNVTIIPQAKDVVLSSLLGYRLALIDALNQPFSGIELCSDIKSNTATSSLPVIVYATPESEDTIISAFDNGAEDFITKPFSLRELIARVKAVLRRHPMKTHAQPTEQEITFPEFGLAIAPESQKVTVAETVIPLTKTEYAILLFLVQNRNSFFTRMDICKEVWKDEEQSNVRIVDTNISRLRKKLGDAGKYIINRYGMGYAFVDKISH